MLYSIDCTTNILNPGDEKTKISYIKASYEVAVSTGNTFWIGQVFKTYETFDLLKVSLYCMRHGTPGTLTLELKALDGDGKPTGDALFSETCNVDSYQSSYYEWNEIKVTRYTLSANTSYAFLIQTSSDVIGNYLGCASSMGVKATYADGYLVSYEKIGPGWTKETSYDLFFDLIGVEVGRCPTYKTIDCDLHINVNINYYGISIPCDLYILTSLADACTSWEQSIRLLVTINSVDVTSALIGNINITHNKNIASTFSLSLGDSQYSPHINSNIGLSKEVVITAYINGYEKKLITGIIDDINMSYSPDINININGMDYSKKLLEKRDTLISVQDETDNSLRNEIIEYIAEQAEITNVDIPEMDTVDIDNSFSDQTIWDMIQKEALINLYWVRFNEEGVMQLKLDEIKSSTGTYPTVDWTYEEDRVFILGLRKNESEIINKIIVLGAIYEKRIPTTIVGESVELLNWTKTWGEDPYGTDSVAGTYTSGDFTMTITVVGASSRGIQYSLRITWVGGDYEITDCSAGGDSILIISRSIRKTRVLIGFSRGSLTWQGPTVAGSISIFLQGKGRDTTEWDVQYNQISAQITDPSSITKHKERDGGSIELPLIETQEQCIEIGKKIIRDSHRGLAQPNFEVPLNPLLETGQTVEITDKKIGFSAERWYVESVTHNIETEPARGRTQVGCVYYAST